MIKTDNKKLSDNEVLDMIDITLSYRKTYEWFKSNNIKIGDKRLRRLYNKKKEKSMGLIKWNIHKIRTLHTL